MIMVNSFVVYTPPKVVFEKATPTYRTYMSRLFTRYFNKKALLLAIIFCTALIRAHATSLSGTYTIDSSQAATATNFKTFASAIAYLTGTGSRNDGGVANSFPFGVVGPVVFMVAPGTYTEQVAMSGAVTGISAANNVSFVGTNNAVCVISYAATTAGQNHTVKLTNARHIIFRNLTIRTTGTTYGWAVHMNGATSLGNKIKQCLIRITSSGANSASANFGGIVVSGSTTTQIQGVRIDSLEIDSNIVEAGYYGIVMTGLSGNMQLRNRIRGNKVYNSHQYGIYAGFQDGIEISGNTVVPRASNINNNGIGLVNSGSGTSLKGAVIQQNCVSRFGVYGIYVNASNNDILTSNKGLIINNIVGGGVRNTASSALSVNASKGWSIANNTLVHDIAAAAPVNAALYITGGADISVMNNIMAETKGGFGLPMYVVTGRVIDSMNFNVFYRADTSSGQLIYHDSAFYNTGSFINAGGFNQSSVFAAPRFVNDTNLRVFNRCNKGLALPYITNDADGNLRSAAQPVIGAHEPPYYSANTSLIALNTPLVPVTPGLQPVSVQFKNSAEVSLNAFTISYVLNNGTPVTEYWTGNLGPCDTTSYTFTTPVNFSTVNYLKIYISSTNTVNDENALDDTLNYAFFAPLSGAYTLGGSTGDFRSFNDLADALQTQGITGPVSVLVNPGTYPEKFVLNGPVGGSSAQNTITIEGTNAAAAVLINSTDSAGTVSLKQCSYITFRNLTITNTFAGNAAAVLIAGNNSVINTNIALKKCVLNVPNTNAASKTFGILVTGSATNYTLSDNRIDSLELDSNVISGANTGIAVAGNGAAANALSNAYNRSYKIRNNTIATTSFLSDAGININNVLNGLDIMHNTVTTQNGTAIRLYKVINNFTGNAPNRVVGNKVRAGQTGLHFQQLANDTLNPMIVANNEIYLRATLGCNGIYYTDITAVQSDRIYHNTVYIDSLSTAPAGSLLYYSGDTTSEIKNNILVHAGKGTGIIYPVYIEKGVRIGNLDHNIYFNAANDSLVFRNGQRFNSSNFRHEEAGGASAHHEVPAIIGNTNLHLNSGCPRGTDVSAYISYDLEAQPRSNPPSIGCYEFAGFTNDLALLKIIQPAVAVPAGLHELRVLIANRGNNTVSSFDASFRMNNGTVVTQNWNGSLAPCDTVSVLFTGTNRLNVQSGYNNVEIYVGNPNAASDGNRNNDTLRWQFATPMSGIYTIGSAPADYTSFTAAVNDLTVRGINGPVWFNVKTGTYSESFSLNAINGSSAVNTITIQSAAAHRDSVLITYSGSGSNVIELKNASYITLRNLSINQGVEGVYRNGIYIQGVASHDTIDGCNITIPAYTFNLAAGIYTSDYSGTGLVVNNSTISGGYGNVMINEIEGFISSPVEHKNARFTNNKLLNAYGFSAYFYRSTNLFFVNNTITSNTTSTYTNGVHMQNCDSAVKCLANTISGYLGGKGIYFRQGVSASTDRPLFANNAISIGSASNVSYGIQAEQAPFINVYHNSVNIGSASLTGSAAHFIQCNDADVKNNAFSNPGGGYALHSTVGFTTHSDFNNLFTTGPVLVRETTSGFATLADWKTNGLRDSNSISYRPGFTGSTNLKPDANDSACWSLNGRGMHLSSSWVQRDLEGNLRPADRKAGVPDIGAYEINPLALPPLAELVPATAVPGTTQVVLFGGDTVAKLFWDASSSIPQDLAIRQYSGNRPAGIGANEKYMNFYLDMSAQGSGSYNYGMDVYYKKPWLGSLVTESDMLLIQKNNQSWFLLAGIQPDSISNIAHGFYLTQFNEVTVTDLYDPLPVTLIDFGGYAEKTDVRLTWRSAAEKNLGYYAVERSFAGTDNSWQQVAKINAKGSEAVTSYELSDLGVFAGTVNTVFYRLRMVDKDGSVAHNKPVSVRAGKQHAGEITVYPNPFQSALVIFAPSLHTSSLEVSIYDASGSKVMETTYEAGSEEHVLNAEHLAKGVYLVRIRHNDGVETRKLVKN